MRSLLLLLTPWFSFSSWIDLTQIKPGKIIIERKATYKTKMVFLFSSKNKYYSLWCVCIDSNLIIRLSSTTTSYHHTLISNCTPDKHKSNRWWFSIASLAQTEIQNGMPQKTLYFLFIFTTKVLIWNKDDIANTKKKSYNNNTNRIILSRRNFTAPKAHS